MFPNAVAHNTGKNSTDKVAFLIAAFNSSTVISSPSRYFIIKSSSQSATASIKIVLYSSTLAVISAGISISSASSASFPSYLYAFKETKSIIPQNSDSAPIGNWIAAAFAPSLSLIVFKLKKKSAPILSILFAQIILGTLYSLACLQTVSV